MRADGRPGQPRAFFCLAVDTTRGAAEAVSYRLQELGAGGVELRDIGTDLVRVVAYYSPAGMLPDVAEVAAWVRSLAQFGLDPGPAQVEAGWVAEEEWAEEWKRYYHPLALGRRLLICPSWEIPDPTFEPHRKRIILDPGQAFGTGQHPTTQMAAELLETAGPTGRTVLDVGCGSGILTLAALALGARRVVAIDIDPLACEITRDNLAQNRALVPGDLKDAVSVIAGSWEVLREGCHRDSLPFDIVVANILAEVIIPLAADLGWLVAGDGLFIGSGISAGRRDEVAEALRRYGWTRQEWRDAGDWRAVLARRGSCEPSGRRDGSENRAGQPWLQGQPV